MSLTFNAGTNNSSHGNTGTDPTAATLYAWVYPTLTTTTGGGKIFNKTDAAGTGFFVFSQPGTGPLRLRFFIDYTGTDCNAGSVDNVLTLNAWNFIAAAFDGTNAPKIYRGSLTTLATEVSYSTSPTAPTGSRVTDGGASFCFGNNISGSTAFTGSIAMGHFIQGTALTLGEIQSHQFRPRPHVNSKVLSWLGFNGTGTQPDWSGHGFNGTVTGATQSANAPIPFPFGYGALEGNFPASILNITKSASDTLSLSDNAQQLLTFLISTNDVISLSDLAALLQSGFITVSDAISLSDILGLGHGNLVSDTFNFLDASNHQVSPTVAAKIPINLLQKGLRGLIGN